MINYVQSPIGLVPKAGGKTQLIFHLSYDFGTEAEIEKKSINFHMPKNLCTVKYNDLDCTVKQCLQLLRYAQKHKSPLYFSKSDCSHAFRILPVRVKDRKFLAMKARHPVTLEWWYFVDKCLPFGASISCSLFQEFSVALRHITEWKLKITINFHIPPATMNYLDDFLFIALTKLICDGMMEKFLLICQEIGCPISMDKTEWGGHPHSLLRHIDEWDDTYIISTSGKKG